MGITLNAWWFYFLPHHNTSLTSSLKHPWNKLWDKLHSPKMRFPWNSILVMLRFLLKFLALVELMKMLLLGECENFVVFPPLNHQNFPIAKARQNKHEAQQETLNCKSQKRVQGAATTRKAFLLNDVKFQFSSFLLRLQRGKYNELLWKTNFHGDTTRLAFNSKLLPLDESF